VECEHHVSTADYRVTRLHAVVVVSRSVSTSLRRQRNSTQLTSGFTYLLEIKYDLRDEIDDFYFRFSIRNISLLTGCYGRRCQVRNLSKISN